MEDLALDIKPGQVKVAGIVAHCPTCDHDLFETRPDGRDEMRCVSCGDNVGQHELLAQIARWALFKRDS